MGMTNLQWGGEGHSSDYPEVKEAKITAVNIMVLNVCFRLKGHRQRNYLVYLLFFFSFFPASLPITSSFPPSFYPSLPPSLFLSLLPSTRYYFHKTETPKRFPAPH